RRRAATGREEPSLGEQAVQTHLGHGDTVSGGPPAARAGHTRRRTVCVTHVTVDWRVNQDHLCTMTLARLIPLSMHATLEMLLGLTTMVAPFVLDLGPAAAILGVVLGALMVGMALSLAVD